METLVTADFETLPATDSQRETTPCRKEILLGICNSVQTEAEATRAKEVRDDPSLSDPHDATRLLESSLNRSTDATVWNTIDGKGHHMMIGVEGIVLFYGNNQQTRLT